MDLLIVNTTADFIAAKSGGCKNCTEKKLGVTIMRALKLSEQYCLEMRRDLGLRAVSIKCECHNFQSINYS